MAMRKIWFAAFDGSPKTPPIDAKTSQIHCISYRNRVIVHFVPNFVAMATRISIGVNINGTVKLANPDNLTLKSSASDDWLLRYNHIKFF